MSCFMTLIQRHETWHDDITKIAFKAQINMTGNTMKKTFSDTSYFFLYTTIYTPPVFYHNTIIYSLILCRYCVYIARNFMFEEHLTLLVSSSYDE